MDKASLDLLNKKIEKQSKFVLDLKKGIGKVIVGQDELINKILISIISNGHILLEGVPGLAKTLTINTIANLINADFQRIQFTPDMLPADLIGTLIYNQNTGDFVTKKGPIFSNIILADEINRAPSKVQSALLESMQERQITIGEETFKLNLPFLVLATQNPIEQEGTYPLPEAQIDRFMIKVIVDYPEIEEEQKIINLNLSRSQEKIKPIVSTKQILTAQESIHEVYMDEKIEKYILDLIFCTRYPDKYKLEDIAPLISFGASPRGSINLALASKCYAFVKHRGYVIPEDVREVIHDVLRHRIGLTYEAEAENVSTEDLITKIINTIEVP